MFPGDIRFGQPDLGGFRPANTEFARPQRKPSAQQFSADGDEFGFIGWLSPSAAWGVQQPSLTSASSAVVNLSQTGVREIEVADSRNGQSSKS